MTIDELKELRAADDECKCTVAMENGAGHLSVGEIDKWLDEAIACAEKECEDQLAEDAELNA